MRLKYGMELIMDLHECDITKFSRENLDSFFKGLCDIAKMTPVGKPKYWKETSMEPHLRGYSGVQFIKTSDIIIHTLDITHDAYINFFSCKDFNVPQVIAFIVEHFDVGFYHYTQLKRGHHREKNQRETEIEVRFIDQSEARYETFGDFFMEGDKMIFQITRSGSKDKSVLYNRICLVHEMIEYFLCLEKGITADDVDKFDFSYKIDSIHDEPGADINCPYYEMHRLAEQVEKMMCKFLGVDFANYYLDK
jgi:S-adenosylmethionine/arginine decarboxylase-like enzyme